ncbi:MAG: ABC transporter permease [Dehalococcoidales bacterium]|nr:ABC transporter permease [Dehalococcoidales bacterium]
MAVASAFFKRDLSLALSYRLSFALQLISIFFSVASFYFLSKLFGSALVSQLAEYGGDYFSFVLIGLAFNGYLSLSLSNFSQSIRDGQMMGTLEIMLLSPTRLSAILVSSSLWSYLLTTVNVLVYFIVGILLFGFDISKANFLTALVVMILSIASFSSIGILSAAFVLLVKKGDPVSWIYGGASSLLSGVLYPISVLPGWLEPLSRLLPMTYALDAMRLAMLKGYSLYDVRFDILVLLAFTVVLTPLAFMAFSKALKRAKMEGSLIQY